LKTRVLIIGGGVTGTGIARDLALRGVECVLAERRDLNTGASGGNHGLLHSGARYITSDPSSAQECQRENQLLKRLANQCIEDTGGLFVAVKGDDENYVADFSGMCGRRQIPVERLSPADAREIEPALSPDIIAAYRVNDASIDPFKISIGNIAQAQDHGTVFLPHRQVIGFEFGDGRIRRARLVDTLSGRESTVTAEFVISACGAWAGDIAALCGLQLPMVYSKGSLLVTQNRITQRVVNRLRPPSDGDILVPGGTVSILGTTSVRVRSLSRYRPSVAEVDRIIEEGTAMIPQLADIRYIRAYCGIRPLIESRRSEDDRTVSRGFALIDHREDGIANFLTVTGGKLTTFRLMAEKAADFVCRHLDLRRPCRTHTQPLPLSDHGRWTEPGLSPRYWFAQRNPEDMLLCECEMVPKSVVDNVLQSMRKQHIPPSLRGIGLRSRVGKGPCQGAFCGTRVTAALYDQQVFDARRGIDELKAFISARWRGQRALMWGAAIVQAELQEAMQCGYLGLELEPDGKVRGTASEQKPVEFNAVDE